MPNRLIDRFEAILLDMGKTFMFNVDHFSEKEDFGATYRQLGGSALNVTEVHPIISALLTKYSRKVTFQVFYGRILGTGATLAAD